MVKSQTAEEGKSPKELSYGQSEKGREMVARAEETHVQPLFTVFCFTLEATMGILRDKRIAVMQLCGLGRATQHVYLNSVQDVLFDMAVHAPFSLLGTSDKTPFLLPPLAPRTRTDLLPVCARCLTILVAGAKGHYAGSNGRPSTHLLEDNMMPPPPEEPELEFGAQ